MNIIFLGYYSHGNYGDDLFEVIFKKLFGLNNTLTFYDPNNLTSLSESTDIIICGGGDIINDFFMKQICKLKIQYETKYKKRIPTYALSIGITYKKSIYANKPHYLDIFDYFIVRNKIDAEMLITRYGLEYVKYIPDIVHGLNKYKSKKVLQNIFNYNSQPTIGIFLTNTISNEGKNKTYDKEVKQFAELIEKIPQKYQIHLVPFNTGKNKYENDNILNNNIYKLLTNETKLRVHVKLYSLKDLINTFRSNTYTLGICMRYHSHILCQTYNIPFISLSMTNKTFEYMRDFGIDEYYYSYDSHIINIPELLILLDKLSNDKTFFSKQIQSKNLDLNLFTEPINKIIKRNSGPEYFDSVKFNIFFNNLINDLFKILFKDVNYTEITNVFIKTYCLNDVYNFLKIDLPNKQKKIEIINLIMFEIFGTFDTEYNFGLSEKILTCNLYENLFWIFEDKSIRRIKYVSTKLLNNNPNININLNFNFIDNIFPKDAHRSGWYYVTNNLITKYHDDNANIIIDLYVDKTFLWQASSYEQLKKIPYIKPWIGFIHHTPDSSYSEN